MTSWLTAAAQRAHQAASSAASGVRTAVQERYGNTAFGRLLDEMGARAGLGDIGPLYFNFADGTMEVTRIAPKGEQTKTFKGKTVDELKDHYDKWMALPQEGRKSKINSRAAPAPAPLASGEGGRRNTRKGNRNQRKTRRN